MQLQRNIRRKARKDSAAYVIVMTLCHKIITKKCLLFVLLSAHTLENQKDTRSTFRTEDTQSYTPFLVMSRWYCITCKILLELPKLWHRIQYKPRIKARFVTSSCEPTIILCWFCIHNTGSRNLCSLIPIWLIYSYIYCMWEWVSAEKFHQPF